MIGFRESWVWRGVKEGKWERVDGRVKEEERGRKQV